MNDTGIPANGIPLRLKLSEKYVDKSLNFITKFCIGGFGGLRKNPGKKVDFP